MTLYTEVGGSPETWAEKLGDTTSQTIVTGTDQSLFRLESLVASCTTGGSTFSLWIDKGATDVYIIDAKAISANDYLKLEHPVIVKAGWSLMCKDHTGAKIDVTATIAKIGKSPSRG